MKLAYSEEDITRLRPPAPMYNVSQYPPVWSLGLTPGRNMFSLEVLRLKRRLNLSVLSRQIFLTPPMALRSTRTERASFGEVLIHRLRVPATLPIPLRLQEMDLMSSTVLVKSHPRFNRHLSPSIIPTRLLIIPDILAILIHRIISGSLKKLLLLRMEAEMGLLIISQSLRCQVSPFRRTASCINNNLSWPFKEHLKCIL